jgi:hypothetical protein
LPDCIRDVCMLSPNLSLCKSRQTFCVYLRPFQFSPLTNDIWICIDDEVEGHNAAFDDDSNNESRRRMEDRILYPKDQWNPVQTVSFSLLSWSPKLQRGPCRSPTTICICSQYRDERGSHIV